MLLVKLRASLFMERIGTFVCLIFILVVVLPIFSSFFSTFLFELFLISLGANSLLDIVVFGRACALHIGENLKPGQKHRKLSANAGEQSIANLDQLRYSKGSMKPAEIRTEMQKVMQNNAAVYRTGEVLAEGVEKIDKVAATMDQIGLTDRTMVWNTDLIEALELQNLMGQAVQTMHSANERLESR